jgi:hypothetical protein
MSSNWTGAPECGRGLPTCEVERMNFASAEEGAWGTRIFWKQVGHSMCPPLLLESAVMCWPQTGHANLNSLIGQSYIIPHPVLNDNQIFPARFSNGAI